MSHGIQILNDKALPSPIKKKYQQGYADHSGLDNYGSFGPQNKGYSSENQGRVVEDRAYQTERRIQARNRSPLLNKVEKVGGKLQSVEFDNVGEVRDPGKP